MSPNRVYVHAAVHEAFAGKLAARVAALQVGPATDPASQIGPMINERAVEKIERHVQDAVARGAKVLAGGRRLAELGQHYYAPTVLTGADATMACACEETFGPVAPLTVFHDEARGDRRGQRHALRAGGVLLQPRRAADLAGGGPAGDGHRGHQRRRAGGRGAPFGGVKESGYGREGSTHGLDDYLHTKYVCQGGLG